MVVVMTKMGPQAVECAGNTAIDAIHNNGIDPYCVVSVSVVSVNGLIWPVE